MENCKNNEKLNARTYENKWIFLADKFYNYFETLWLVGCYLLQRMQRIYNSEKLNVTFDQGNTCFQFLFRGIRVSILRMRFVKMSAALISILYTVFVELGL